MNGYVPPPGDWARIEPASAGMSAAALDAAGAFARQHDSDWPATLYWPDGRYVGTAHVGDTPPHDKPIGIVRPRGGPSGMVVRGGRIVAQWGDTARPDTTFSAAKSYIALMRLNHDSSTRAIYDEMVPMRRYGTPEEIANGVLFLASDQASYVTGHTLMIDGGFIAAGVLVRDMFEKKPAPPIPVAASLATAAP